MKRTHIALAILALAHAAAWIAVLQFWVVHIDNPCNTFVSEFAPNRTPALERKRNEWELIISFTPAEDNEALRVYSATWLGERTFEVSSTGRRFKASSRNGLLRIRLASKDESHEVLKDLCFKGNGA